MPTTTPLKFYQVGSLAVGNRLVPEEHRSSQSAADRRNAITSGHRACQGCGEALGARYVVDSAYRATEGKLLVANATGCLEVFSTPFPESSWQVAWLHSMFGNSPAIAAGMARALKVQGRDDVRVLAQAGDGGTFDIGLGCLSGVFERNDDVLFVCYDNEGYMNTGDQRGGRRRAGRTVRRGQGPAPHRDGARHPVRRNGHRRRPARPRGQVTYAMGLCGASYLHVHVPCPLGWGSASADTVRLSRLAKESGLFPVFEAERGEVTGVTKIRRRVPVEDYLRPQKRYAHLFRGAGRPDLVARIQAVADRNIARYGLLEEEPAP